MKELVWLIRFTLPYIIIVGMPVGVYVWYCSGQACVYQRQGIDISTIEVMLGFTPAPSLKK